MADSQGCRRQGSRRQGVLISAADGLCLAPNSQFRPDGVRRDLWGMAGLNEARRLGRIEGDLAKGDAEALINALDERMGKEAADAALAAAMSKRTADAVARMEAPMRLLRMTGLALAGLALSTTLAACAHRAPEAPPLEPVVVMRTVKETPPAEEIAAWPSTRPSCPRSRT